MSIESWIFAYGSLSDLCDYLEKERSMTKSSAMTLADQICKYPERVKVEELHVWGDYACAIVRSKQDVKYVEFFTFGHVLFNDPL